MSRLEPMAAQIAIELYQRVFPDPRMSQSCCMVNYEICLEALNVIQYLIVKPLFDLIPLRHL
jgi:hypothetical protein